MAKRTKMAESELASLLDDQISDAVDYDRAELAPIREKSLEYREGTMSDLPAEEGKSSVVSHDVQDTIGWIKPGLMRVFLASDRVADYQPRKPQQIQHAKDATDFVNYVFLEECQGYKVLADAIDDGLGSGNGVIKHWWDASPCYETESFSGLSDELYTLIANDPDVEVLEHTARVAQHDVPAGPAGETALGGLGAPAVPGAAPGSLGMSPGADPEAAEGGAVAGDLLASPAGAPEAEELGEAPSVSVHDLKIKRKISSGRLCIEAMPPEEFLISRNAKVLDETIDGCGHKRIVTRSELIKEGYDKAKVNELPAIGANTDDVTQSKRDERWSDVGKATKDASMERVKIYEWYPLVDYDGDGVAERRKVVIGDRGGTDKARTVLENEEWGDDLPFTDLVPDPVPHRWRGRSMYDETGDLQRLKSAVWRQIMDNTYLQNNQQKVVLIDSVVNPDELINPTLGGVIWVKRQDAITPLVTPNVAADAFQSLEYADAVIEKRTGVSRASMALDPETLQNQTATAVNAQQSAAMSKVELYARNMAETGLKRLFKCILKLIVKHQDQPKMIRLKGQPVEMDPRAWDAFMDVSINVGLGAGSRDKDMMGLQFILMKQELALQTFGPGNPLVSLEQYRNALAKAVELTGLRSPELYFGEITQEVEQQMVQQMSQKPDPKVMELQMKGQLETQKMQMGAQLEQAKMQQSAEIEKIQAQADIATQQTKTQAEMALAERRFELEREMKLLDAQLKREEHQANLHFRQQEHAANLQFKTQDQQVSHHFAQKNHELKAQAQQSKGAE